VARCCCCWSSAGEKGEKGGAAVVQRRLVEKGEGVAKSIMAENQRIEQILCKLVELLTAKKDDIPSSSKEIDMVQKLELMPVDIKLEGMKNYLA